jgi:hypothetical protein
VPFYLSSGEAKQQAPGSPGAQGQLSKGDKALLAALPYVGGHAAKKGRRSQAAPAPDAAGAGAGGSRAATSTQVLQQQPEAPDEGGAPRWGIKSAPAGAFVASAVAQAELAMLLASAARRGTGSGAGELRRPSPPPALLPRSCAQTWQLQKLHLSRSQPRRWSQQGRRRSPL